jgi:hypothetical protein
MLIWALFVIIVFPELFRFVGDVFWVSLAVFFLREKKIIFIIALAMFFILVKYLITRDTLTLTYMLPWVRPFILLGLFLQLTKGSSATFSTNLRITKQALVPLIGLLCAVSYVGLADPAAYAAINNFWHSARLDALDAERGGVAVVAAAQGRISSIFGQPAAAGLAFYCIATSLLMLRGSFRPVVLGLLLALSIFFGLLPQSTFFVYAPIITVLMYFLFRLVSEPVTKRLFAVLFFGPTILFFMLIFLSVESLAVFGDEDLMAGRLGKQSHALSPLLNLSWSEYIFGSGGISSEGIRIGDSAITMRIVLGGILFHLLYQLGLLYGVLRLMRFVRNGADKALILSALIAVAFGEFGFTSFSQPGVTFLVFLPLLIGIFRSQSVTQR